MAESKSQGYQHTITIQRAEIERLREIIENTRSLEPVAKLVSMLNTESELLNQQLEDKLRAHADRLSKVYSLVRRCGRMSR